MSLLDEYNETFELLDKVRAPDGMGGYTTTYTKSVEIEGALAPASETEIKTAEAMKESITHVFITNKYTELDYHDVLRRVEDGQTYRVTAIGDGIKTPGSSSLNLRKYALEKWELPMEV